MFYECKGSYIANYADDATLYYCASDTKTVISELKFISNKLFFCAGKCHLLLSSKTASNVYIGDASLTPCTKETLLRILIDSELSFEQHVSFICSNASKTLHTLERITSFVFRKT